MGLLLEDLDQIVVPKFNENFEQTVARTVEEAERTYRNSLVGYSTAEDLLLRTLGLENWQPPAALTYEVRAADVWNAERLDAEHYQPKYDAAEQALKSAGAVEFVSLDSLLDDLGNGHTPLHHDLTVGEVPFLCAEHVGDFRLDFESDKRVLLAHHHKELAASQLGNDDVLMTIKGRVGNAALVEDVPGPVNINQDVALLRFKPDALPIWYIVAFLNSLFGKMEVARNSTGQINPFLALGNLRRIRVPVFSKSLMDWVAQEASTLVRQARSQEERAAFLLDLAKRAVEVAIEDGEDAGMALLETAADAG